MYMLPHLDRRCASKVLHDLIHSILTPNQPVSALTKNASSHWSTNFKSMMREWEREREREGGGGGGGGGREGGKERQTGIRTDRH